VVSTKSSIKSLFVAALLTSLAFVAGCGGGGATDPFTPPPATPALVVSPNVLTVFQGTPATVTIDSGVAPFQVFTSNTALLPVVQAVAGKTFTLSPTNVLVDTGVTITVRDAAGQSVAVSVTVRPTPVAPIPALVVNPTSLTVYSGIASTLTIERGVAPFQVFSSDSLTLPVTQNVSGTSVPLLATTVTADKTVTITVRDSASQSVTVTVTVKPVPVAPIPPLVVNPVSLTVYSGIPSVLTIERGVGPFQAFSSDSLTLPVVQSVSGLSVFLVASNVTSDKTVTITVRDAAGQSVTVPVTVKSPPLAGALVVTPTVLNVYSGTPARITVNNGVAPFQVFTSDAAVLPVLQAVSGSAINFTASTVSVDTVVTLTVRDAGGQSVTVAVTVKPSPVLGVLSVTPTSNTTCGGASAITLDKAAICSGESGVASITVRTNNTSVLPNRQIRFEVVQGAFNFLVDQAGVVTAKTLTVTTDQNGKADVAMRMDSGVPSQAALIRATDLTSGNRVDGAFTIVQAVNGAAILSVIPPTYTGGGGFVQQCLSFAGDYVIYGGTAPYTITNGLPNAGTLSIATGASGQRITVASQGGIFRFTSFDVDSGCGGFSVPITIADATGRTTSVRFVVTAGTLARAPAVFSPRAVSFTANLGGSPAVPGQAAIPASCSDGQSPLGFNCPTVVYTASSCGSGTVNGTNTGCLASVVAAGASCGAGTLNGSGGCLSSVLVSPVSCGAGTVNASLTSCLASQFAAASCSAGGTVSGNACVPASSVFTPASCSNGGTVSGSSCTQPTFVAAVCSNGGVAQGNTCSQPVFTQLTCSNGGTVVGSTCQTPAFTQPTCNNNLFTSSLRTSCEPSFYRSGSAAIPDIPAVPPKQCSSSSVVFTINGGATPYIISSSNAGVIPPTAVIATSPSNLTITFPILNVGAVVTVTAVDSKGELFTSTATCNAGT
jgi:hypothetical protein